MNHNKNVGRVISLMLLLTAVFTQSPINAQSLDATDGVTINYLYTIGAGDKVETSIVAPLHYYNNNSVFLLNFDQEDSMEFENDEAGEMEFKIKLGGKIGKAYFIDRNNREIIAQEIVFDEPVNVEENIPVFVWLITNESKKIAEYDCYEATTSFRGRSFSAWFTPDVPLDVGPWKFSGLPGAILQVNDKEGNYNWYCKSIGKLAPGNKKLIKYPRNKMVLSPKEYQDLFLKKFMDLIDKLTASPSMNTVSEPNFEYSLERTFN